MFPKKKKEDNELIDNMDTELFMDEDSDAADDNNPDTPKKKLPGWVIVPIIGVIILIAVVGSLFAGEPKETTTALTVTEVTTGTVREVYNSSGTIESENSKTYYSPVTAPVLTCNAIVGQPVKSGDLLVTFDTANLERDNQQAQLSLQSTLNS